MQDLVGLLDERLGTGALHFRYLDAGGSPNVVLDLDWKRDYETNAPLRLDLGGDQSLVSAAATGQGSVHVKGGVKVGLVVPLAPGTGPGDAASLKVLADSTVSVAAAAAFTGRVAGTVGPLTVSASRPMSASTCPTRAPPPTPPSASPPSCRGSTSASTRPTAPSTAAKASRRS